MTVRDERFVHKTALPDDSDKGFACRVCGGRFVAKEVVARCERGHVTAAATRGDEPPVLD